jgi:hypothetical protein
MKQLLFRSIHNDRSTCASTSAYTTSLDDRVIEHRAAFNTRIIRRELHVRALSSAGRTRPSILGIGAATAAPAPAAAPAASPHGLASHQGDPAQEAHCQGSGRDACQQPDAQKPVSLRPGRAGPHRHRHRRQLGRISIP